MSMYAKYLKERTGDEVLETDKGFATYRFLDKSVYIMDIYVLPDFRKSSVAIGLADEICKLAKEKGCTKVIGSVVPSAKSSTDSLRVLLGYGMELESSGTDFILFQKEI